jgi:S-adenosyl-L-methionine hydrolase (adenosine-forming)
VSPRTITFLSDFGLEGVYVGLCHAVMATIAPAAPVADLTHEIPPQDVRVGAMALADCVPYVPAAVHLAVVDPGVGSQRRGVVLVAGDALLVGPDNGLLLPAARRLGGVTAGFGLSERRFQAARVSRTFHGRDVFSPAAAHLAAGVPPPEFGDEVDLDALVDLALPVATVSGTAVAAPVRDVDRFGNVRLAATAEDLARASGAGVVRLELRTDRETFEIRQVGTYSDLEPGELGLLVDSFGWLAVVMDRDAAARRIRVHERDVVRLVAS